MALVEQQDVEVVQRLAGDLLVAQFEPGRRDEHEVLVVQDDLRDAVRGDGQRQQHHVEASGEQFGDDVLGLLLVDRQLQVGELLGEPRQDQREQVRRDGRDHTDPERPHKRPLDGLDLVYQAVQFG